MSVHLGTSVYTTSWLCYGKLGAWVAHRGLVYMDRPSALPGSLLRVILKHRAGLGALKVAGR